MSGTEAWQPLERLVAVINAVPPGCTALRADGVREALRQYVDDVTRFDDAAVRDVAAAASQLRPVLSARSEDDAARALNEVFAAVGSVPRLSDHDGSPWHLHVDAGPFSWHTWFLASSALGLALLLSERGRMAWGICAAEGCGRAYVDDGRGGRREYCSTRCASRSRVAAHRERRRRAVPNGNSV